MPLNLWNVGFLFALFVQLCVGAPNGSPYDSADFSEISNSIRIDEVPEFDLLIYTQRWPITACYEWREHNKDHICGLPDPETSWTIHGIWPTKLNTVGPAFCDKSAVFNVSQLSAIEQQLEQHWINVEKNKPTDSLWEHEWLKHGTCAAQVVEQLNTEAKYFGQGLAWLEQYSVGAAFAASSAIKPGYNYSLTAMNKALYDYYGKDLAIECYHDSKTHLQFLNEVRICFDKLLQLTDCDGIVGLERIALPSSRVATVISNCNVGKPIFYPAMVPEKPQSGDVAPEKLFQMLYEVSNTQNGEGAKESYEFVEVIFA
ncbi:ribonuclease Oy [Anopheles ziemanni]|uniref:ribonuclease Oy n=1 Tax=Anopheles coustani TaxID=139045 RepID=UPI00265ADD4F|nr:ribonuclease Oy [Anopheles coustani]XP_058177439.1 ribonuclease Oy [Anopheles ziemanni]